MTGRGLTAATLCSGIGAPEAARPDFRWLWSAEIDDFPATVYADRFPGVENLGDITSPGFPARASACGPLDLLVAGTPCQAFSVAGRREGLADDRGNLTLRFAEIVHELRQTCGLRFVLWENVPGVLSDKTNAFGCLLGSLCGLGEPLPQPDGRRWPAAGLAAGPAAHAAWRVLDAQFFGVPQRRRRVYLVVCFGPDDPAAVLLERAGLLGDSEAGGQAGEGPAAGAQGGARGGGGEGVTVPAVCAKWAKGTGGPAGDEAQNLVVSGVDLYNAAETGDAAVTVGASAGSASNSGAVAPTLRAMPAAESHANGGGQVAVALCNHDGAAADVFTTVRAGCHGATPMVGAGLAVRRLTPRECERLQGFPDDWTLVDWRHGKPASDGPRYKAIGNSMAVPVLRWILTRLEAEKRRVDRRLERRKA